MTDSRACGFRESREYPAGAVRFLQESHFTEKLFNDFEFGGYLAWHGFPPFLDSRGPGFYPQEFFRKYLTVIDRRLPDEAKAALEEFEREWGFTAAVVHHYMPRKLLEERLDWKVAYSDEAATVFVKKR